MLFHTIVSFTKIRPRFGNSLSSCVCSRVDTFADNFVVSEDHREITIYSRIVFKEFALLQDIFEQLVVAKCFAHHCVGLLFLLHFFAKAERFGCSSTVLDHAHNLACLPVHVHPAHSVLKLEGGATRVGKSEPTQTHVWFSLSTQSCAEF